MSRGSKIAPHGLSVSQVSIQDKVCFISPAARATAKGGSRPMTAVAMMLTCLGILQMVAMIMIHADLINFEVL